MRQTAICPDHPRRHEILHVGSCPGSSYIFHVSWKSVQGSRSCGGSKIALSHWQGPWLIQQLVLPYKPWCSATSIFNSKIFPGLIPRTPDKKGDEGDWRGRVRGLRHGCRGDGRIYIWLTSVCRCAVNTIAQLCSSSRGSPRFYKYFCLSVEGCGCLTEGGGRFTFWLPSTGFSMWSSRYIFGFLRLYAVLQMQRTAAWTAEVWKWYQRRRFGPIAILTRCLSAEN